MHTSKSLCLLILIAIGVWQNTAVAQPALAAAANGLPGIYIDSSGKKDLAGVRRERFLPLGTLQLPTVIDLDNCRWNYWLLIETSPPGSDSIFFGFGAHHFITLYHTTADTTLVEQGGLTESRQPNAGQGVYYFRFPKHWRAGDRLYVRIYNRPRESFQIDYVFSTPAKMQQGLWQRFYQQRNYTYPVIACVFVWAFMVLFSLAQYGQHREKMYLYYLLYLLSLIFAVLKVQEKEWGLPVLFSYFPSVFIWSEAWAAILPHIFYRLFVADITDMQQHHPTLLRIFNMTIAGLLLYGVIDIILEVFFFRASYGIFAFMAFRYLLSIVTTVCIVMLFRIKTKVARIIAVGSCIMYLGAVATTFTLLMHGHTFYGFKVNWTIFSITCEILLFSTALGQKARQLLEERNQLDIQLAETRQRHRLEEQELILQQELALRDQRDQISQGIHDDLGAGLSGIRIAGERILRRFDPDQARSALRHIVAAAAALDDNRRALAWATDPEMDTLGSLLARLRRDTAGLFEQTDIAFSADIPLAFDDRPMAGARRLHLLRAVLEGLNNALRHADASAISLQVSLTAEQISILIRDNGKGFDRAAAQNKGKGLKSIEKHLVAAGGTAVWESEPDGGTALRMQVGWKEKD